MTLLTRAQRFDFACERFAARLSICAGTLCAGLVVASPVLAYKACTHFGAELLFIPFLTFIGILALPLLFVCNDAVHNGKLDLELAYERQGRAEDEAAQAEAQRLAVLAQEAAWQAAYEEGAR